MRRTKKILLSLLVVPVVLVAGAWLLLDHLAKKAVEIGGERAMGVPTSVDSVSLRPFLGEGGVKGLQVSNPQGFESPFFMRLSQGDAALDLGSLTKDTVVMKTIDLDGFEVYLEKTSEGSNYKVILENMKKGEEKGPGEEGGKKFVVEQVSVRNVRVHADVAIVGQKVKTVHLNIDEIRLENVGSGTDSGVVMSRLMGMIVKAVLTGIVEQGGDLLPDITKDLASGLGGLGKVGVKVVGKVTGQVGSEAVKILGGAAKGAIKGIFGGGDKDK